MLVLRIQQLRLRQDFLSPGQVCSNAEIFGNANLVVLFLASVGVCIGRFVEEGGGEVNDVTTYLREVIITLI